MRVLSEIASTDEPGICSAVKYSAAMKGTVNPATLVVIFFRDVDRDGHASKLTLKSVQIWS